MLHMSFSLRGCALAHGVRSTPFCFRTALVELSTLALIQIAGESCAVRSSQSSLGKRSRLVVGKVAVDMQAVIRCDMSATGADMQ